ncbi:MAG TPA: hypothetical protein VG267_22395 [Terracidiphilus sp.]|jgi:hypothetical protein|nr:hypothetical protein [Terracidiphilus sp.]
MSTWKKILIPFVITIAIGGIYLFSVWRHRQQPGVQQSQQQQLSADDVAAVRMEFPAHFDDLKDMEGKSVWMKNGNSMPYFPYAGGRVEWSKPAGPIPPDQKLDVKKIIKAVAPASVHDNIEHGDHQAMLVFALPGADALYATPAGFLDGQDEHYFSDLLFYYDDPHTIYANWQKDVWAAIDAHQVKPGMSELQTRTAIGMKATYDAQTEGDRTVDYDVNGKHIKVTYIHNRATSIQPE